MSDSIRQVAARIKELRLIFNESIEKIASELGILPEDYAAYEEAKKDIPVSLIFQLANRYKVEVSALLTGNEPKLHIYSLVRNGEGLPIERRQEYNYYDLAYKLSTKKSQPFLVKVPPQNGDTINQVFSHDGQEFIYMLEGEMKVQIDNHDIILLPGDALYFDSKYKHGMAALNGVLASFVDVLI